jgi:hypothetical protein
LLFIIVYLSAPVATSMVTGVPQLGQEHSVHQGGDGGQRFALQNQGFGLELDMVGLVEELVVGGVRLHGGQGADGGLASHLVALAQTGFQLTLGALEFGTRGGIAQAAHGEDADAGAGVEGGEAGGKGEAAEVHLQILSPFI